jgi:chromate transporter
MCLHFMLLSLLAVGGAITTTPEMQRWVVGERGWLTDAQFTASVALAQAAPGPNLLFVAVIGWNVSGLAGVAATLAGQPAAVVGAGAAGHALGARSGKSLLAVRAFKAGMAPLTIGMLLATGWVLTEPARLCRPPPSCWWPWRWASCCARRLSPLWPIAIGAAVGRWAGWAQAVHPAMKWLHMAPANTAAAPRLRPMRWSTLMLTVALSRCRAGWLLLWWGQERLLFHPCTAAAGHRFDVAPTCTRSSSTCPARGCTALHLQLPRPTGVVFYLHGNAGNLDSWFVNADFWPGQLDLFMLDYRGYGKSSGRITSQAQLHADVRAAWAAVAPRYRGNAGAVRPLAGHRAGGQPGGRAAARTDGAGVALFSLRALAAEHYRWVPRRCCATRCAPTRLPRVKTPVLLRTASATR